MAIDLARQWLRQRVGRRPVVRRQRLIEALLAHEFVAQLSQHKLVCWPPLRQSAQQAERVVRRRAVQPVAHRERELRFYRIALGLSEPGFATEELSTLALPDKPSIAVLPFQNMSGDPEQEYFVDGLVDEIITALSRFRSLFVIARNSSFAYKGKSPDLRQVGRDLGVRYVLEGSVRKSSSSV